MNDHEYREAKLRCEVRKARAIAMPKSDPRRFGILYGQTREELQVAEYERQNVLR